MIRARSYCGQRVWLARARPGLAGGGCRRRCGVGAWIIMIMMTQALLPVLPSRFKLPPRPDRPGLPGADSDSDSEPGLSQY